MASFQGFKRESVKLKKDAPVDPTHIPAGVDHSTFFTPQIPETVKLCVPLLHAISAADSAAIIDIVVTLYVSIEQQTNVDVKGGYLRPKTLNHIADTDYGR